MVAVALIRPAGLRESGFVNPNGVNRRFQSSLAVRIRSSMRAGRLLFIAWRRSRSPAACTGGARTLAQCSAALADTPVLDAAAGATRAASRSSRSRPWLRRLRVADGGRGRIVPQAAAMPARALHARCRRQAARRRVRPGGLTNSYAVDAAGSITMPLIGAVPARGLTTARSRAAIAAKLRNGYHPRAACRGRGRGLPAVLHPRRGHGCPGQYPYVANMTVETAVAIAGGFTPRADKHKVERHPAGRTA